MRILGIELSSMTLAKQKLQFKSILNTENFDPLKTLRINRSRPYKYIVLYLFRVHSVFKCITNCLFFEFNLPFLEHGRENLDKLKAFKEIVHQTCLSNFYVVLTQLNKVSMERQTRLESSFLTRYLSILPM